MTARVGYLLGALLLGVSALAGVQDSGATFTDDSSTLTQVTAARDWTPPTISVNDPGSVVHGMVTIVATAADEDTSVASVTIQYRLQGSSTWELLCDDVDGSPWDCLWDTDAIDDGTYELRAIATDEDGNTDTSAAISTEVYNTAAVVIDPVPSPVRGTVRLTAHMVNVGSGASTITFQVTATGTSDWVGLTGCTSLTGPGAFCDFDTTLRASDTTYDLRAVGTHDSTSYDDIQIGILVDNTAPTVTVNQKAGQADPTSGSPINFSVVFSEPVTGFEEGDVALGGTSGGTKTATVTGSGTTYNIAVVGMSGSGSVTAVVWSGVAADGAGNPNPASTSTDNIVMFDSTPTSVSMNQSAGQVDPTNGSPINYTVTFSRAVTGFTAGDVTVTGTAGGTKTATVTGSGTTYNVAVSGMETAGTVIGTIAADVATDAFGSGNAASTSVDNVVTYDAAPPTVTINQAAGQTDPTAVATISFTAIFSEAVGGFTASDVTVGGTAGGAKSVTISGSGATYTVQIAGMTSSGTVTATVSANSASDASGNQNTASTSTDNAVAYTLPPCTVGSSTVTATADASTAEVNAAQNYGGSTALDVESRNHRNQRSLVRFVLPTVPVGCSVTGAILSLYNTSSTTGRTVDVYRAATTWAENLVTWSNQPGITGTAVGSAAPVSAGYQQWTVTDHVRSQYSGANDGFVLKDRVDSTPGNGETQSYRSREAGSVPPQLVITWGAP